MISAQTINNNIKCSPKKIKLPKQNSLEEIKNKEKTFDSSGNLAEMCNFQPDGVAFSPPDGNFMKNLRIRMEKV